MSAGADAKIEPLGGPLPEPSPRAGIAVSLAAHGLVMAALLIFMMRQSPSPEPPPRPVFIDLVDAVPLGARTAAPPAPVRAPVPQQAGAKGPRGAPKPEGVRPHGDKPFDDPLAVQLKQLAKLRNPDSPLQLESDGTSQRTASSDGADGEAAYGVRDAIRAAILRRWNLNLTSLGTRDVVIRLRLTLLGSGEIGRVSVDGESLHRRDLAWMDVALSAEHAAQLSAPFPLPESLRRKGLSVTLELNPRDALR